MFNIPEDQLPKEWKDEDRINVLFAPLRSRTVNPNDWNTKVTSWKNIIHLYCINNEVYSFTIPKLIKAFVRNGRPPSCLNLVIEELINNHEIIPLEEFLQSSKQSWGSWAANILIKKPITWSLNTLKKSLSYTNSENKTLVHLEVIKEQSKNILAKIPKQWRNKLISLEKFKVILNKTEEEISDIKLLLHYLENDNKLEITNLEKQPTEFKSTLLKFGEDTAKPITEVDVGIYVLEQNEEIFTRDVENLEDEIGKLINEAKTHLVKGHKQLAKNCLRKKHEIEKRLTRKLNALHNVQVLLEKIRDVHTDAEVWLSYKHALSAFDTSFKETGLTENAVEDVMLKLGETMDIHDDIQAAISRPVIDNNDDDSLEKELEELIESDEADENKPNTGILRNIEFDLEKLDLNLPDVPNNTNQSLTQEASTN